MTCFMCLVEYERRERKRPEAAFTVYKGMALCSGHVNTVRGLPATFVQYPAEGTGSVTNSVVGRG